jgi:hypothetical protein
MHATMQKGGMMARRKTRVYLVRAYLDEDTGATLHISYGESGVSVQVLGGDGLVLLTTEEWSQLTQDISAMRYIAHDPEPDAQTITQQLNDVVLDDAQQPEPEWLHETLP